MPKLLAHAAYFGISRQGQRGLCTGKSSPRDVHSKRFCYCSHLLIRQNVVQVRSIFAASSDFGRAKFRKPSVSRFQSDDILPQPYPLLVLPFVGNGEQAALSCLLAQQRSHAGPETFDWGKVSTKPYIRVVNRLIPEVDTDLDALDDEELMSASKERRNLTDVFLEKRRGVSSLKLRTLLKVCTEQI